jgi:hypothetical protein
VFFECLLSWQLFHVRPAGLAAPARTRWPVRLARGLKFCGKTRCTRIELVKESGLFPVGIMSFHGKKKSPTEENPGQALPGIYPVDPIPDMIKNKKAIALNNFDQYLNDLADRIRDHHG